MVDKSATTRAVNKLEELGYVIRKPDAVDKRSYRVFLTPRGREIKPQLEAIVAEMLEVLLKGLSAREKDQLKLLLQKIAGNIIQAVRSPETADS